MAVRQRKPAHMRGHLVCSFVLAVAWSGAAAAQARNDTTDHARAASVGEVRSGPYDGGKMWPFEYAPSEYFTRTYGFKADAGWFERARLGALRTPGCSAAFVSPAGLVITNHHCARGGILDAQRPGEHLLDTGFFSSSLAEERKLPGFWVEQLIAINDVSDEVFRALEGVSGDSLRGATRERTFAAILQRMRTKYASSAGAAASIEPELVALYHGGRYSAYIFRRYTDVRLVGAPEEQMGFFGGEPDNFTYPRYDLDFSLLRVYGPDGKPMSTPSYFPFSTTGATQGDAVFVIGNPGPTSRGLTVAQLEFQRDVELPPRVAALARRLAALRAELRRQPAGAAADQVRNSIFSISNSLKARRGSLSALHDPIVMARRSDAEAQFRAAIRQRPELSARFGGVFDQIAALQREKARLAREYAAFGGLMNTPTGTVMDRALQAMRLLGSPGDTAQRRRLLEVRDLPPAVDESFLAGFLGEVAAALGPSDSLTRALLGDRTPEQIAAGITAGSALATAERTAQALGAGTLTWQDPGIRLIQTLWPRAGAFFAQTERLGTRETDLNEQLGRARLAVYGTALPPDATFSPRIADGVVQEYEYNGTRAPWHTTFYGLYDRYWAFRGDPDFALPQRWVPSPQGLDLSTSLDFISTADTFGGNSGSPAVSKNLELLGLNFDRNVEGLSRGYIYLPELGQRNVMVDVRAIRAALAEVYGAGRIVAELAGGKLE